MNCHHLFNRLSSRSVRRTGRARTPRPRWRFVRPRLELLEDRVTPANITLTINPAVNPTGAVQELVDAITFANTNHDPTNTINLFAGSTYGLTTVNNFWYGPDGLPAISSNLTINGNGATIQRDSAAPNFRLFYVSGGISGLAAGSLTLNNLTLQSGVAQGGSSDLGGGGLGAGGAIFNQGTLDLNGVTLTNNQAIGGNGAVLSLAGAGGGGMGQDSTATSNGGGFGGLLVGGPFGSNGGIGSIGGITSGSSGGGGGGFRPAPTDNGQNGRATGEGGNGGGVGGFGSGGSGGGPAGSSVNDGGDGGSGPRGVGFFGGKGGDFGIGGFGGAGNGGGGGGGGGVGGGGGGNTAGNGGGGGFGGGGGSFSGEGGFGGGGGGGPSLADRGEGGFGGGAGGIPGGGGGGGMGGAVFNMFGSATFTNCTLTADTAQGGNANSNNDGGVGGSGFGGAVFNLDGRLDLTFCTLADNTVASGIGTRGDGNGEAAGGAVYNLAFGNNINTGGPQSATTTILNSILSNSIGGVDLVNNLVNGTNPVTGLPNNNSAIVLLEGPNLVMSSSADQTSPISGAPTVTANPQVGPLQNNGGPTSTMAITTSSPAFNAGIPVAGVTTDQRGVLRPATPSLGAFEPEIVPPPSPAQTSTGLQQIVIVPAGAFAAEFVTAVVTSPDGTVNGGTMSFNLDGTVLNVLVQSGRATALMILPLPLVAMPQQIDLSFTPANPDFASSSSEQSARLTPFNALNAGWVLLHADGSQKVVAVIDGVLVGLIFNPQGQFIGFSLNLLTFNANGQFTGLDFNTLPDLAVLLPFTIGVVM